MRWTKIYPAIFNLLIGVFISSGCFTDHSSAKLSVEREPAIEPDYSGVTIPHNIAPLNFCILDEAVQYTIRIISSTGQPSFDLRSRNGLVRFPQKKWRKLLSQNRGNVIKIEVSSTLKNGQQLKYKSIPVYVSEESIDPYLCYRMLYPGYESWSGMKIIQRSLEDFSESSIIENQLLDGNCVNCHTFRNQNPEEFLLHVRGSQKGTYFIDGETITRRNLRTENMIANAVHPAWHPNGRFIVFSSNEVVEVLHMMPGKRNEIYDRSSSLVLYDSRQNTISGTGEKDSMRVMDTFPCWTPDGKYLYFCRATKTTLAFDGTKVRYDLVRKPFDHSSGLFGDTEVVMDANEIGKSISLPRISPDGKYLVFVLHNRGTFPIWHKDADLYLLNLDSGNMDIMNVNSEESESYHTWSSNGKWLVFSSKRGDGITARPYFAYFGSPDDVGKPFVLPQKDPRLYNRLDQTFNKPEFVNGKITIDPRDFSAAAKKDWIQAVWDDYE